MIFRPGVNFPKPLILHEHLVMYFPNRLLAPEDKYFCDTGYVCSVTIDFVPNMGRILSNYQPLLEEQCERQREQGTGQLFCMLGKGRGLRCSAQHCAIPRVLNQNIISQKRFRCRWLLLKIYIEKD